METVSTYLLSNIPDNGLYFGHYDPNSTCSTVSAHFIFVSISFLMDNVSYRALK